jgi:hypothetical protein
MSTLRRLVLFPLSIAALGFTVQIACAGGHSNDCTIVTKGHSPYVIVIPISADSVVRLAAEELQSYLYRISEVSIPLVADTAGERHDEISVGWTNRAARLLPGFDQRILEEDGYKLVTRNGRIMILGGSAKGTLYGVYALLEDYLGCRMYSATVTVIPRHLTIRIPQLDVTWVPRFHFREIHYLNAMDRAYSNWHKLHSLSDQQRTWGMWVHTFDRLVPAREHFTGHPEYFSLVGSGRIPSGQLCLSQPQVFTLLTRSLQDHITAMPAAHTWSVSQNDNYNECQCGSCREQNAHYGASSGTMLAFVNRVAQMFPDRTISTLAYQYTRSAPRNIVPASNVNIMLCSIECNRSEPIATDPRSASFRKDVEDWSQLTNNILMWDYVVQFRNLVSPFPNLRVLQPNIQFFANHNIRMMFQQGCGANIGEFGELRTYLIAKLLWNPWCNLDSVMNDFLSGYYGPAGRHIRRYIDTMHDALAHSGKTLDIYGYPYNGIDSYLTPRLIKKYAEFFDAAELAVRNQPAFLERVRIARLPLEFAILDISLHDVSPELSYFDKHQGRWTPKASMRRRLEDFVALAQRAGIQRLEESGTSPAEYQRSVEQQMKVSVDGNLAFGKPVKLLTPFSDKYPVGGSTALTNGLHGPNDYHCNWLGFEHENVDAVIDLGTQKTISAVSMSFLQMWYAWIWLPVSVDVSISADGVEFKKLQSIANQIPDTTSGSFVKEFRAELGMQTARYVRVSARSRLVCPDWHIGAGQKSWIFIDEIVVQ